MLLAAKIVPDMTVVRDYDRVEFRGTGPGVPADVQSRVFDPCVDSQVVHDRPGVTVPGPVEEGISHRHVITRLTSISLEV
ncbi:hypothetical protein [Streptomyces sp. NBC_00162]|uniref:hypothetical protein n=1 Tax=Streptomyces sp. NBC_00162 TaxID=2903629 RepID=UPI00214A91CE|nr:hypothetical protein [Streptomyces sp. NBC_00162]UUU38122.1 hypothetical protein JIW86_04175 [Streptomyces sp. NBC_00162]